MDSQDSLEKQNLLNEEIDSRPCQKCSSRESSRLRFRQYHICFLYVLNIILAGCLIWSLNHRERRLIYSPADSVVRHKKVVMADNIHHDTPYQGTPDDEKDTLWDMLYRNTSKTLITPEQARRHPDHPSMIPGLNDHGLISLEVFHQLHCLNTLRKSIYPHRFPEYSASDPNRTRADENVMHLEHCVDRIRQGIQCASNTGSIFYYWRADISQWVPNLENTHQCRDFDAILQWARTNSFAGHDGWDTAKPRT